MGVEPILWTGLDAEDGCYFVVVFEIADAEFLNTVIGGGSVGVLDVFLDSLVRNGCPSGASRFCSAACKHGTGAVNVEEVGSAEG